MIGIVRERVGFITITVVCAGVLIIFGALALGMMAGLDADYIRPLATKSVSAPIAIEIAEKTGAATPLKILAVFSTGHPGAVFGPGILRLLQIKHDALQGLILGVTSHAFGVASATEIGPRATAFATIGMGLMGCFVALVVPFMLTLLLG
ncbi:LrgB family protein [Octadecabacter sp.]|nr:LrgB family protein [Octadecabacter sp.]